MTDRDLANKRTSAEGNASVCRLFFFPKLLNNCYSIVKSAGIRLLAVIFFFFKFYLCHLIKNKKSDWWLRGESLFWRFPVDWFKGGEVKCYLNLLKTFHDVCHLLLSLQRLKRFVTIMYKAVQCFQNYPMMSINLNSIFHCIWCEAFLVQKKQFVWKWWWVTARHVKNIYLSWFVKEIWLVFIFSYVCTEQE